MELITSPERAQCVAAAFSMAVDNTISPETLMELAGHDGLEIVNEDAPEPFCYRGHSWAEFVIPLLGYNYLCMHCYHTAEYPKHTINIPLCLHERAVLLGVTTGGAYHAVAWDGREIFDPDGFQYSIDKFRIIEYVNIFADNRGLIIDSEILSK